jgi:hypothetical protein
VSEAPANVWLRPSTTIPGRYFQSTLPDECDAVRYVRADLYEALLARLAVVRSWNEAPCLEPLGTDCP